MFVHLCVNPFALDKDQCGYNAPSCMSCDPISWKQSRFTASDRANLFLHQLREGGGGGGGTSPTHFQTDQQAHIQYTF